MRSLPLILLALFLPVAACGQSAPPAPSEPWILLLRGAESLVSVDTSQIERAEHGVKLWIRFDYTSPDPDPGNPGEVISRVDMLDRIDCAAGRVNNLRMRTWNPEGTLLSDEAASSRWSTISEHPLGRNVYSQLCGWLARPEPR